MKSFAAEEREDSLFREVSGDWAKKAVRSWDRSAVSGIVQSLMLVALQVGMLGAGVLLWARGEASPGDFASLIATQFLINGYLRDIGQHVRTLQRTVNDMDDVLEFREADLQVADVPDARPLVVDKGRIGFDHVTFRYSGANAALYEDFSLVIPAGQRVGLVGHSGSGKTTFVKLIQRLYDVDGGRILIDGQDIAQVHAGVPAPRRSPSCSRSRSCSTARWRENIAYGGPTPRGRRSSEAARARQCARVHRAACRRATRRWWASAASSCRAASGSASPSPARSWPMRRS